VDPAESPHEALPDDPLGTLVQFAFVLTSPLFSYHYIHFT